jgi:hypothetical protein
MPDREIHFMGILANTDASILKVHLEHGFKFKSLTYDQGISFVSSLERWSAPFDIMKKLTMDLPCLHNEEKSFYYISNVILGEVKLDDEFRLTSGFPSELMDFNKNLIHEYLKPSLRLMRLFKEGNICMPLEYYFVLGDDGVPRRLMSQSGASWRTLDFPEKYSLGDTEVSDLEHFLKRTKLPFQDFLELAFENFELSYETYNRGLSFLSLMISLETLFNPEAQELRYRVSRNAAVLLGTNSEESEQIFSEVKKLYDKRSKLVHTGSAKIISKEDLSKLRDYVRSSIKKVYSVGMKKEDLLAELNSLGFGGKLAGNTGEN